jgi:hypothetical protein
VAVSWATVPTSGRDLADAGWATTPTSCRDQALGGQLYGGAGMAEIDTLLGSGTTTSAAGWTTTILESCRDAE